MSIQDYTIIKQIGKGKSGYSYLAKKDDTLYVLKKIHHEPVLHYHFQNKMEHEINAYNKLSSLPINIPQLIEYDMEKEYIVKEYIDGEVLLDAIASNNIDVALYYSVLMSFFQIEQSGINIDYFPANFVIHQSKIYYIDYEVNEYSEKWNFTNWGVYMWFNPIGCKRYQESHDETLLVDENGDSSQQQYHSSFQSFYHSLQSLDISFLQEELRPFFDLSESSLKPISDGYAGTSFILTNRDSAIFIKLYGSTYPTNQFDSEVQTYHFQRHYLPTLLYSSSSRPNKTKILVLEFLPNQLQYSTLSDPEYCDSIIPDFTSILYSLHQETTDETTLSFVQKELQVAKRIAVSHPEINPFIQTLEHNIPQITVNKLCKIHRDYHPWNYIQTQHQGYMIDMKDQSGDYRFDVYWTYTLLMRSGYEYLANQFVQQYESYNPSVLQDGTFFKLLATLMWYCSVITTNYEANDFLSEQIKRGYQMMIELQQERNNETNKKK